jgi:hypothetical protein
MKSQRKLMLMTKTRKKNCCFEKSFYDLDLGSLPSLSLFQ